MSLGWHLRVAGAFIRVLLLYWLVVLPHARRELHGWRCRAAQIASPVTRRCALAKLESEHLVAEGAALFAVLAAPRHRRNVIRAAVAYEVLYDLIDVLGEQDAAEPLAHNRCVHSALIDALAPHRPQRDHFAHCPALYDGGYVASLVETCREALVLLPAYRMVLPPLERFASRAAEAQSLNHAGAGDDHRALSHWATAQRVSGASWWEVAAAASDPLGVFALLAVAGARRIAPDDVAAIEASYFPWIGALVWLMESLVDHDDDVRSGNHSYVARYGSPQRAAARLAAIAAGAADATTVLPRAAHHRVLLSGVTSLYLSAPTAGDACIHDIADAIRSAVGGPIGPLLLVLRLRRRLGRRRARAAATRGRRRSPSRRASRRRSPASRRPRRGARRR